MQNRLQRLILILTLGASILTPTRHVVAQSSTTLPASPSSTEDFAGGKKNRMEVVLRADHAPAPGDLATLTFGVAPLVDAPDLQIEWLLPSGAELVGGPTLETYGAVGIGHPVSSTRQIRFLTPGVYKMVAEARIRFNADVNFAATGVLFFTIKADGSSSVSTKDPAAHNPNHSKIETEFKSSSALPRSKATPQKPNGDPCFNVSGSITRIDRPITSAGRGAAVIVPLRFAKVEMRESDTLFDDSYGETTTDANGNYSFGFCDDDGVFDDTLELYIRLRAEIRSNGRKVVEVEDSSYIDEVYEFDTSTQSSGGGSLTFNMNLNEMQSSVFNIADAVFEAWSFWNNSGGANGGDATFGEASEVHWEPGYGDKGSYYMSFWEEMTIADDPSDPDEWDDSVIMHEWAHSSDDEYSCDDNPGGTHFVNKLVTDPELSWGEGYPNYYQSAVRAARGDAQGNFYFDINGSTVSGIKIDLETWDSTNPSLVSTLSEFAIAAALWDLRDNVNDGGDRVFHGHNMLQNVFTSSSFESNGFFDDTCTFNTYMQSWKDTGKPTDGATAAAVTQNTGLSNPFGSLMAYHARPANKVVSTLGPNNPDAPTGDVHYFDNYKWWQQLTLIADNSASMAGSGKFASVQTVLTEQVNDLSGTPKGVEFALHTFNNNSTTVQTQLSGRFYPDQVTPAINTLSTIGAADPNCEVNSLDAMLQTLAGRQGGDAWLFTDGDSAQTDVTKIRQGLQNHQVRGSFALLGGCSSAPGSSPGTRGSQKAFLGLAANKSQPGGIVPYLLTSIASGGQFLYVNQNQLANAADIMRAQLSHSAGAGRWSDYVSDSPTYLQDRLASWEYHWQDLKNGGGVQGSDITFTTPFTYWDVPRSEAHSTQNGFLTLGNFAIPGSTIDNTALPNAAIPNNTLYPLWDLLSWDIIICNAQAQGLTQPTAANMPNSPNCGGPIWSTYSVQANNLITVEVTGTVSGGNPLGYEVILNQQNGEIRFQYQTTAPNFASSATIGIEDHTATRAVQVSLNDANGASNGMGYKFTPAPAQPSKIFTVPVDSLMSSVGFLLTGYSGDFDPLDVRMPDGSTISCADIVHVLCLNLGLVQYVQADVLNHTGVWTATVAAGPSGAGTFSFSSLAASPITASSPTDHSRSTANNNGILINLGQAISSNGLDGWFQQPDGTSLCPAFKLFDDGAHGDGFANDGRFGSAAFNICKPGTGYLHVKGTHNGVPFERIDSVPFTFQPIQVQSLGDGINLGFNTPLLFKLQNDDTVAHCYRPNTQLPAGWTAQMNLSFFELLIGTCVNPGGSIIKTLVVTPSLTVPNTLPSGTVGEVNMSFTEIEQGIMSDGDSARVTRYNPASTIEIVNEFSHNYIRPNNVDTATLRVAVTDNNGFGVADGTEVVMQTSLGSVTPVTGTTVNGQVPMIFTAGAVAGDAIVTATASATGIQATTTIHIHTAVADHIDLVATPNNLPPNTPTSALVATVFDRWGDPVPNQTVRIGVEDDGQLGLVNGSEVLTGTTNAQGQISGTFSKVGPVGPVGVRAEALQSNGGFGFDIIHEDREIITIGTLLYMPVIQRQ